MNAAAWFAGTSFHAERPTSRPAHPPAVHVDTRPRADYLLPSGDIVTIILHRGDRAEPTITYQLADGWIVTATLSPISKGDLMELYTGAVSRGEIGLKYLREDALGIDRAAREPLTAEERHAAIRKSADQLEMVRAMAPIGGGS